MALWAKYSTGWWQDPKVVGVSPAAELLYARAIAWCKEHSPDGTIPAGALPYLTVKLEALEAPEELVSVALWERLPRPHRDAERARQERGWRFPADVWGRWQESVEQVEQAKQAAAERKRRWADKKAATRSERVADASRGNGRDAYTEPEPEPEKALALATPEPDVRAPARDLEPEPPEEMWAGPTDAGRKVIADIRAGLFNHPSNDRRTR